MAKSPDKYLARAAALAERGRLRVEPNPVVGCVLVKGGRIVGEGWHARFGEAHAERAAIADAGKQARNATAYVTLEPCNHEGRTPPCSVGLIEAEFGLAMTLVGSVAVKTAIRQDRPNVAVETDRVGLGS